MLVISVLEQNTLRTASYDTVNADLEATIKTVSALTKRQNLSEEISALSEDHRVLHVTEAAALKLMRQDRWKEAHQMLFVDSYVLAKKVYEINSETAVGALTGELASTAERFDRLRLAVQVMRGAALLLLLWVGSMFSRRLRAEVAQQARLREEIAASNLELEEKVLKRTSELEVANRQLEALSATDGLTGLANRRKFDLEWEAEWQRAVRQGLPLAVAMLDVDQFKAYNDHYGHQAGDLCLRIVAQTLGGLVQRSGELAARYGGEEFVVILPGQSGAEACSAMERIRAAIQMQGLPHAKAAVAGVVTVSIGVASRVPKQGESSASLVQEADAAMYRAKNQGRNRVVLAS
ncbi:diguanylate cyclase [Rhodoferax sp.]|uniref:GGDEF domain-containing protein n=1 Tax=Rhodoferax sp. TaxID=50421 RepID=UPI002758276B|nr:diguanylate cyclase [Rhodoferax sp.]